MKIDWADTELINCVHIIEIKVAAIGKCEHTSRIYRKIQTFNYLIITYFILETAQTQLIWYTNHMEDWTTRENIKIYNQWVYCFLQN